MRVEVRGNLDALRTRARQVREGARLAAPNDMPREAGRLQVNPVAVPRLRHRPSGFYAIRETRSTSRAHRTFRNGVILLAHDEGSHRWFRVLSCRPIPRTCCRRVMSCRHRWRCESQISHQTWFGCTVSARGMAHASIKSRSVIDSHGTARRAGHRVRFLGIRGRVPYLSAGVELLASSNADAVSGLKSASNGLPNAAGCGVVSDELSGGAVEHLASRAVRAHAGLAGKLARQQDVGRRPVRRRPRGTYSHGVHAPCVGLLSHDFSAKLPGHAA